MPKQRIAHPSTADSYLSLAEAGALAGRTARTIRRWIDVGRTGRGRLAAVHSLRGLEVRRADLVAFMEPADIEPPTRSTGTATGLHRLDAKVLDRLRKHDADLYYDLLSAAQRELDGERDARARSARRNTTTHSAMPGRVPGVVMMPGVDG